LAERGGITLAKNADPETGFYKGMVRARFRANFIGASFYDKYSGLMKITTHLDYISHCKTASGTSWSNRWTYRVFIINTRFDEIRHD